MLEPNHLYHELGELGSVSVPQGIVWRNPGTWCKNSKFVKFTKSEGASLGIFWTPLQVCPWYTYPSARSVSLLSTQLHLPYPFPVPLGRPGLISKSCVEICALGAPFSGDDISAFWTCTSFTCYIGGTTMSQSLPPHHKLALCVSIGCMVLHSKSR